MRTENVVLCLFLVLSSGVAVSLLPPAADGATNATAPDTFEVDAVHSALVFRIRYANVSTFFGRFNEFSGTFSVDEKDLSKTTFDLRVKAESVDSGNKRRDGHLTSPDFFSAKEHPEIAFVSKSVNVLEDKTLEVTGDLTLRGVTKSVKAEVSYGGQVEGRRGGTRAGFDGKLTIQRKDFGVSFGEGQLGADVTIEMGLTGLKK